MIFFKEILDKNRIIFIEIFDKNMIIFKEIWDIFIEILYNNMIFFRRYVFGVYPFVKFENTLILHMC